MGVQDRDWFNEPRDRAGYTAEKIKSQSGVDYVKLYFTIVAAIITAFTIMAICSLLFSAALLKAFTHDIQREIGSITSPQQQNTAGLQRDLQRLANNPVKQISEPIAQRADQLNKKSQQQAAAKKADVQTCDFWLQQYQNEKSDRNKMHANSACGRAHGNLWNRIN